MTMQGVKKTIFAKTQLAVPSPKLILIVLCYVYKLAMKEI
jgi:hypothetical protein